MHAFLGLVVVIWSWGISAGNVVKLLQPLIPELTTPSLWLMANAQGRE